MDNEDDSIGVRIKTSRDVKGWSQAKLAEACEWDTPSRVGNYEQGTREPSLSDIRLMAQKLEVDESWLAFGIGISTHLDSLRLLGDPLTTTDIRDRVPVISFVNAGDFREIVDNHQPGHADEWVETDVPVKRYTFALIVEGDSMEPEFPAGMRIVVEPDMDPENGDYVIAFRLSPQHS